MVIWPFIVGKLPKTDIGLVEIDRLLTADARIGRVLSMPAMVSVPPSVLA